VQQESKKIHTNEEILDRIQKFLNKISVGQNGRLTCSLQAYKGAIISLAIKGSREKISDAQENSATHFNFTENWTALNELDIPAVTTDDLPWYESRSVYTTRLEDTAVATLVSGIHENRTIQGILRFPKLSHAHSSPIPMEYRITHIMEKKIQELSDQLDREKKRKCITTAGLLLGSGIICSAFYLKHAQTLGLPSV
jgi:hypothetical protein